MQKGFTAIQLLIAALSIVVIAGTSYYLGSKNSYTPSTPQLPSSTSTNYPTPQPTPSLSSSSGEIANWKTYSIRELNLIYKLPPELSSKGNYQTYLIPGEKGTLIFVSTEKSNIIYNKQFLIGTTSRDYIFGRGGLFIDFQGFSQDNNKYYAKFSNRTFEIPTNLVTIFKNPNLDIIKIMGQNYPEGHEAAGFIIDGTPGEGKIGALININKPPYQGLAVQMTLTPTLTEQLFDQILSTFKFE